MFRKKAASPLVHSSDIYQGQQVENGSHSHTHVNRTITTPIQQHSYHHNYVDIEEQEYPDFDIDPHPQYFQQYYHQPYPHTEHAGIMTGNGFSNNSPGVLMKSKSGSLPGRYSARGFRDTFISSMNHPNSVSANSSPQHVAMAPNQNIGDHNTPTSTPTKDPQKDSSGKKWSFGGLFKRKVKANNSQQLSSSPKVVGNPSPLSASFSSPSPAPSANATANTPTTNNLSTPVHQGISRTKYLATRKTKLSESDISSYDSENETENNFIANQKRRANGQTPPQQPLSFKQNFLTRRLSKRKEKAAKKAAMADPSNGFLKVPSQLQNGRRVGSSPDSLNNSGAGMNGPWQIWETTKKIPANNYSSSGSLSLSIEGSSKGSRAAMKEAVKARAIARRESYFRESSSSDDEETGDTEERSRSSLQGSHSSLSSRNRRPRGLNYQASGSRRPELIRGSPSSPVVSHTLTSFNEPTTNAQQSKLIAPGSPRWEARIIYQQETLVESDGPVVVKLPKNRGMINSNENQPQQMNYPQPNHAQQNLRQSASPHGNILLSTSTNSDDQGGQPLPVITAGLRVPLLVQNQNNANPNPNAYMTEEVTYANLPQGANNNGNRSITPYNFYSVSPSPPPPPPRRDFTRNHPNQNQHPNFYRPVSCSYLDSYQYHQQGTNSPYLNGAPLNNSPNRNSSYYNNNNNNSYHQEHVNGNGNAGEVDVSADGVTNGYFEHEIEMEPSAVEFSPRNNNFLAPPSYIHHLGRSPSEPPEIKVQFARDSPQNRVASPSPYINNWNTEMNGNTSSPTKYNNQHQPVIMSKLGFPVRRLHEANKLPPTQSPVHLRASEFWRRKEQEISSATNNGTQSQKRFLSRVRSADSSPLPVPRMRNSPATMLNSNESISSLSSFSAEAPSPNLFSTPKSSKIQSGPLRPQTLILKTPGFQINKQKDKESSKSKEKVQSQSACERLKVRLPNGQSPSTTPLPTQQPQQEQPQPQPPAYTQTTNNNKDPATVKSPGRNLEDALNELEDMYKSLRLSDEDLLDRAERRDLPTAHQELRNAPMLPHSSHFSPPGSVESLATGSSSFHSTENLNRVRAPPLRRSSRPDVITDDMAKRRFDHPDHPPNDPRSVVSKTGSYMILSPAFSPPSSPCPPTPGAQQSVHSLLGYEDPDLTLDDVTFRNYKRANSIRIIEPQPPFGIPNVPVAPAPDSDYLHSKPVEKFRPLFRHTKRPDVVKDDIAFRNLRKDLNQENNLSKDWTPRLFSPTRENVFTYNIKPEQKSKKLRAIRSLSANISHLIPFKESAVNCEIGKWNSFTDLNCDESPAGSRASSYLQPSWVEQIEKVQTSTETLTENRSANSRFTLEERKARKLVTPIIPHDPSKPRRPWTDILLESFEREKQAEIERIAAETAAAAQAAQDQAALQQKASIQLSQLYQENSLDDDDVFEDAREESKSTSPDDQSKTRSRYATPEITQNAVVHPFAFHLLAGQKNRRGSWVESKSSSLFHSDNDEDQRRRSWSDVPKDIGAGSAFLYNCPPNSPAKKTLFNPLPPPRKIKQINLNAFNTGSSKQPILSEGEGEIEAELESLSAIQRKWENYAQSTAEEEKLEENKLLGNPPQPSAVLVSCERKPEGKFENETSENSKCSQVVSNNNKAVSSPSPTHKRLTTNRVLSPKSILAPKSPTKGEDELNELMDALLREADTCGPPTTTRRRVRPSSRAKQETVGNEKVILEESAPTASSVVVPANEVTMPKGNSVPLPKIPSKESVFEKVETTTTNTSSSVIIPTSTSENIDNNKPCMGKVPKSDSIEDLIDSINESLPELEASCFKNNNQPNSSSTSSECYIVSSTTTSAILPPPCLDSLKESQEKQKEILPQQQEQQSSYLSPENKNTNNRQQNQITTETMETVADENENLPVLGKNDNFHPTSSKENGNSHGDPLYLRRPSSGYLDQLDIIDDDFQQQAKPNRRGSDYANAPSSSTSSCTKPSNAAADALAKSKQEDSLCEANKLHHETKAKESRNLCDLRNQQENYQGGNEKQMERRQPVASAFINSSASASMELHQQPIGNSCLSESPSENMRKAFMPAMRISTSRSRSHSLISSMSTSPTNTSENGENKKEKDKSYRRKSHLNRAFTEEPVPDIDYSIDLDSEGRKRNRILNQDASLPEGKSTCVGESPKMQKCIQKAPNIPSIFNKPEKQSQESSLFTANTVSASPSKNPSPKLKQESPSPKLKQESPSPKPKNKSGETKGSPVIKRDSFSDAEGVSFIKKLLQKESMEKATDEKPSVSQGLKVPEGNKKESSFCLKKSPSAGSNSYWSRFSNSQPAFLKRFFEKSDKSPSIINDNSTVLANSNTNASGLPEPRTARSVSVQPKEPEKGMGFSVAQKASFFMKLEHEQRFSKWRKNSVAEVEVSSIQDTSAVRTKTRHMTQPVTPTEVEYASQYFTENNNGEANKIVKSVDELFGNAFSDISLNAQENEEMAPLGTQQGISSSYNDCDDSFPSELHSDLDPSNLSLKDRVHMFDKILTTSTKAPISSAPTPRPPSKMFGSCAPKTNGSLQMLPPSGQGQSLASGGTTYSATTTTSTTHFMHHPSMDPFGEDMYDQGNCFPVIRRRGSTSDVELSSTPKYSPLTPRSFKVKSMCMSGHGNNADSENFSEDGEVSSGGQEVAEIISKSYENSPIFRKKIWRNQQKQTQATFSKEIWRRCVAQENWSAPQMSYERPPQNYNATSKIIELPKTTTPPLPPPPTTSNLLPILTALSSSNDELNDPKPISSKIQRQSTFSSTSSSTTDIRNKTEVYVKVPHPDDESFQTFFKNNHSSGFACGNFGAGAVQPNQIQFSNNNFQTENEAFVEGGIAGNEGFDRNGSEVSLEEICSVKRQSDLLVMKKNMPLVRRKSSGKTRNPLKALAARMDFRNQKYTEVHIVDDNSVPNEDQQL